MHNLRSLSFLKVRGFYQEWQRVIAVMFTSNSKLQHFALSVHNHDWSLIDDESEKHMMMIEICFYCCAFAKQKRLKLQSLHLGPRLDLPQGNLLSYDALNEVSFYQTYLVDQTRPHPRCWTRGESTSMLPASRKARTRSSRERLFQVLHGIEASDTRVSEWRSQCLGHPSLCHGPRKGFEIPVLELPVCHEIMAVILDNENLSWITHLVLQLRLPLVPSQDGGLPTAWFCAQTLVEAMPNLRGIWVHGMINDDYVVFTEAIADDASRWERAIWLAMLSASLKYVRLDTRAWRVVKPGPNGSLFALEDLDEWEDELECPAAFYAPQTKLGSWQLNHTYR